MRTSNIDILNVKTFEEEVKLVQEWYEDYLKNWAIDARVAYLEWLEFIKNLKP